MSGMRGVGVGFCRGGTGGQVVLGTTGVLRSVAIWDTNGSAPVSVAEPAHLPAQGGCPPAPTYGLHTAGGRPLMGSSSQLGSIISLLRGAVRGFT